MKSEHDDEAVDLGAVDESLKLAQVSFASAQPTPGRAMLAPLLLMASVLFGFLGWLAINRDQKLGTPPVRSIVEIVILPLLTATVGFYFGSKSAGRDESPVRSGAAEADLYLSSVLAQRAAARAEELYLRRLTELEKERSAAPVFHS